MAQKGLIFVKNKNNEYDFWNSWNRLKKEVAMEIREALRNMKIDSPKMAASPIEIRNKALELAAISLEENAGKIFKENIKDLDRACEEGISDAIVKRLKFDRAKLDSVIDGIRQLILLPDPVGKISLDRMLDDGLELKRISCPIGVIGVIFEARPDALVQISSLCIKSGNCAVLKGGKETVMTNRILFELIHDAMKEAGLPETAMLQAEAHSEIDELLKCDDCVDLLIPRGSNAFVQYIMNNTKIPVMGHADGICHIYVDAECDFKQAARIIVDAKTQYTAACNAVETILINRQIAEDFLPLLKKELSENSVKIRGTAEVTELINAEKISDDEFNIEYLDLIAGVKLVDSLEEAVDHINRFGSHHTDAIMSLNEEHIDTFFKLVDSAGVYANCSTRFADGFRYGFGAEVGISTGKIHARGPVGLEGLVTYKYNLTGHGQIVGDYAEGRSEFKFRDLI